MRVVKRFQVRGPHGGKGPYRWTVVDIQDRDVAVDSCRIKQDAIESAKDLNDRDQQ